jgi:trimethylamine:corrinoid methyltransferase-like protein
MAYLRRFMNGFTVDDGIADVIARGIESGQYLTDPHTLKYLRKQQRYNSAILDGRSHTLWAGGNSSSLAERAWEKALHVLENHQAPSLEDSLVKELDRILAAADKELL